MFYGANFTTARFRRDRTQHEQTFLLPDKVICFMTLRMVLDVLEVEQRRPLGVSVLHVRSQSLSEFKCQATLASRVIS